MNRRRILIASAIVLLLGIVIVVVTSEEDTAVAPSGPPGPGALVPTGRTVVATLPGPGDTSVPVRARVGDLIRLTVRSSRPETVSVAGRDEVQPVDPRTPAQFEFFAAEEGRFPVRLPDSGNREVGFVEVGPADAAEPPPAEATPRSQDGAPAPPRTAAGCGRLTADSTSVRAAVMRAPLASAAQQDDPRQRLRALTGRRRRPGDLDRDLPAACQPRRPSARATARSGFSVSFRFVLAGSVAVSRPRRTTPRRGSRSRRRLRVGARDRGGE